jgi:peptide/nickel transport system substrate-binding protein
MFARGGRGFLGTWLVLLLALALFAAACGDDDDGSAPEATDGGTQTTVDASETTSAPEEMTPVTGGQITLGAFAPPRTFDPAGPGGVGFGSTGGIELRAMYDTVVAWDPETGEYEPRTAASFEPNDDYSMWTLVLKDGITFTDGTPYDAEAVKFNVERHSVQGSGSQARNVLLSFLATMTVIDPLTLEFTLSRPWSGFPHLFSNEVGMIASPTAIQAGGENFGANPGQAGAGPFVLAENRPGEAMVFERNDTYYGGDVYLDRITFVPSSDEATAYESVKSGALDGAFFRSAIAVSDAPDDGLGVASSRIPAGNVIDINSGVTVTCNGGQPAGCEGVADGQSIKTVPPGADIRIRQAIAAAIDVDQVNERTYEGLAVAGTELFQSDFPLSPDVPGPEYDPELAKKLVEEAKADGWDGSIRLYSITGPVGQALGLSISAMLTAVGMDVELDGTFDPPSLIAEVIIKRNYDLVVWGSAFGESPAGNLVAGESSYSSAAAKAGFRGFSSAAMDEGIAALRVAVTEAEITAAYAQIAQAWTDDVPAVALNELQTAEITRPGLHGVKVTSNSAVLLDGAWIEN